MREERELVTFLREEMDKAFVNQLPLLIMGDFNSCVSLALDTRGGNFNMRDRSVAPSLAALGAVDTFRLRHPTLQAFPYLHHNGTASRLDQIWLMDYSVEPITVLNAALLDDVR